MQQGFVTSLITALSGRWRVDRRLVSYNGDSVKGAHILILVVLLTCTYR